MSNSKRKKDSGSSRPQASAGKGNWFKGVVLLLLLGVVTVIGIKVASDRKAGDETPMEAIRANHTTESNVIAPESAAPRALNPEYNKLKGRWVRPDGGYVIEITHINPDHSVAAGYFNPQPISVPRAEVTEEDGAIKLFLELRGPGYPGSTYTLTYQAERDELEGVYFQAAMGAYYDVLFQRME